MTMIAKYERIFVALDSGTKIAEYYQYVIRQDQKLTIGSRQIPTTLPPHMAQEPLAIPEASRKDGLSVESLIATRIDPGLTRPRFVGPNAVDLTSNYTFDLDRLSVPMKTEDFYTNINGRDCFVRGVLLKDSKTAGRCVCSKKFFGQDCGIPASVYKKNSNRIFTRRSQPRRIIMPILVNHELDMVEIRMESLKNVVDVFMISESNVTTSGFEHPLFFYDSLRQGFLEHLQWKILYVFRKPFPQGFVKDGWKADEHLRTQLGEQGIPRLKGLNDDDIFIYCDADEIPNEDLMLFFKLYDGFGDEPIQLFLRWSIYGFWWQMIKYNDGLFVPVAGSTWRFLRDVCKGDIIAVRKRWNKCSGRAGGMKMPKSFFKVGEFGHFAGHHCSWCFSPASLRFKLIAGNTGKGGVGRLAVDKAERTNLEYIYNLIKTGAWFDGDKKHLRRTTPEEIEEFAPPVVMGRPEKYRHLLVPPEEWRPQPPPITWVEPTLAQYGFNETHLGWGSKQRVAL